MRVFRCVAGALLCCTVAALIPATKASAQQTQGSSLAAAANYPYHCDYRWAAGAFGPGGAQQFEPQLIGPSTCSVWQSGTTGQPQTSHLVPGTGTVTKARVKAGPNPAPVSIATVRMFEGRSQSVPGGIEQTCCRGVSETPTVNLTPNAVTEIPVNFRVETKRFDPNTGAAGYHDVVVVNVHGTSGTLPIHDTGAPKPFALTVPDPSIFWYFPQIDPSQDNLNRWHAPGFEVLMNYDWVPEAPACPTGARAAQACPPAQTPGTPTPPKPVTPVVPKATPTLAAVKSSALKLRRGRVGVRVACTAPAGCKGRVRIRTAAKKPRLLGSRKLSIKAGKTATVNVGVAAKNRRYIKKKGTSVTVEVDLGAGGKVSRKLVLKR